MQRFMVSVVELLTMVGMGVDFDLAELVSAMSPSNLLIALMIVAGAVLGSALAGKLAGFYPIDSAITAGLCMTNRGGSGDIAVLGAANRLDLISYAQLSSRVGGGFIKGRRDQDIVFCRNICSRSGCTCLDIDYVPAPDMRYPGQVYACY